MKLPARLSLVFGSFLLLFSGIAAAGPSDGYQLLKTYHYAPAAGATREYFDYITVDSAARRVYLGRGTEVQSRAVLALYSAPIVSWSTPVSDRAPDRL